MHLGPEKTQTLIPRDCGSHLGRWQERGQELLRQLRVEEMLGLRCLICGLLLEAEIGVAPKHRAVAFQAESP